MKKEEFYERKVLTDSEYNELASGIENAQEALADVCADYISIIKNFMANLWEKVGSKEFVIETEYNHFTLINRFGSIGLIDHNEDDTYEADIDDLDSVNDIVILDAVCNNLM